MSAYAYFLSLVLGFTLFSLHLKTIDAHQGARERRASYRDPEYIQASEELSQKLKSEYNVGK